MAGTTYLVAVLSVMAVILAGALGLAVWAQLIAAGAVMGWVWLRRPTPAPADPVPEPQVPPQLPVGFGRALLHRMPAALMVIGPQDRLIYVNPAARAMLPQAQVGVHFTTAIRAPSFREAITRLHNKRADFDFSFSQMQGRERFYQAQASFLPSEYGAEFGGGDQIIVLIEDRTRDRVLLKARSDFVANASHELRTPLASILGYIETLQGHARDDPEAQTRFLEIMMQQASRMQRLVDDLMSLNRIEMNAHVRPDATLPLYQTVSESAAALFPVASRSDVLLQIEIPEMDVGPQVLGDRDQIAQVVVNLVDNAIKYGGPEQKVRVIVAEPTPRYPRHAGITVIDQGPGIARENIPRLTERFYRVSAAKSRDRGGTGLGLAITKHILARHGGALDIQSQLGEGSRFTFWLPIVTSADPKSADPE